uniref:E1A binding protein p400 n=1 Tax=Oncorhynchus tshawytscha TaxID=74940 RepID=A0A8C8GRM8_ONCTS
MLICRVCDETQHDILPNGFQNKNKKCGPQNVQRQLQRSKSTTGSEQATANHPQSTVTTFASGASPSGPQSPNYQIIMSRSPVTGQNMNITLQNVSQMVTGNQQITLTPLPLQNPGSPGFQHTAPQWRFEPAPSYIQVTSPLPQSPTQHSPVPLQRPGAPVTGLGLCGQSPTRFVDAGMLVRQISLGSPPGSGHFVYQEGTGLTQLTPTTAGQVQLSSPGVPGSVRERSLSQPHSQTGGTIHHLGPQSPVASGTVLPTLGSPGHITTSNLPPQISSIIQGQLARPMIFEKTSQGMVTGVGTAATVSFSMPSTIPPSSPSLINPPQGIPNTPLTPTGMCLGSVKKQIPKKLEEIAPSNPEVAQLRKQCLEHHTKKMEGLKEVFKDYLIELFFLQHLQGNMMDYLAFKKKPCVPLFTYLRQNDLDLEEEEEEEEQSEVINDETVQIPGQKQNQPQYDPSKGPPVQNAASLHTPPPQLPGRLPQGTLPMAVLPMALSQQSLLVDSSAQATNQLQVKVQGAGQIMAPVNPHTQLQAQLQQQMQSGIHLQIPNWPAPTAPPQSKWEALVRARVCSHQKGVHMTNNQVHQRISELRKEGQWSASRLPKLMESSRPKSHWDYLLEEMQWMAADFAQERRWKMAAAKKLVRTCSRYHDEQKKMEEGSKKEEELRLRHIASTISREVEFFWSNIEQVVEIKLRFQIYEKRLKTLSLQRATTFLLCLVSFLAEMPLDALMKQYAGAYADNFDWPQPSPQSDEDEMESSLDTPHEAVVIDSLLSVDQYRGSEKTSPPGADGKPKKDIAEVAASTELILPKGSARTTTSGRSQAPFLLHGSLREYQQIGVDWLASLHKKHLNGILADETGLGKTVQTVAYLAHLACQEGIWGPHLVVVRTCKILSWEMEFKRWCPGLKILLYLGNRQERRAKRMWWAETNSFHVCVTSYKLLLKDQSHFLRRRWKHLVLDEVQLIKNMSEKHWETIFALKSQQRILLINTPLQNTLKELWTMIHFLLPGITRPYTDFPVKPGTDQNQDYCHKLVIRLHRMIQPFILRRCKRDVEKQLPKKYEHILKCRLSSRQKSMYEDILTQPGAQEALKTGHFVSVLQYNTPSLVLGALQEDQRTSLDLSLFDLISNENRLTRYEMEEVLPKLKVTRQLIEEIHSAPDPPARPKPCKIKPMRSVLYPSHPMETLRYTTWMIPKRKINHIDYFYSIMLHHSAPGQHVVGAAPPVAQGQALCGVAQPTLPGIAQVPRLALGPTHAIQPSLVPQRLVLTSQAQARLPSGDVLKIAQLASIAGSQNRISQPETPVTLQFQGNKFTLSPSQLRQLTTGQPLQLQGNILQIVSAPGQQILRPQGSMVMQTVPQAAPVSNSSTRSGTPPPAGPAQQGKPVSSEERGRHLKERLSRLFSANERRCDRSVLYGADLLQVCSVTPGAPHSALSPRGWRWVGRDSCLRAQRTPVATTTHLQSALLSCVVPAAVARPPYLYAANPPAPYSLEQKSNSRRLQEAAAPHSTEIHSMATGLQFPDLQLMQMDSGKLEALAILLQKLRSENRRVLIFTQMVKMLDILEAFLDHRQLTYIRVDESLITEERQEHMKTFNRNRQVFCSILTNRCCSAVGTVFDADTIIFYDTDLNPSMDARTQEWCDKIGRSKDIHIYRLESGNSIEEKLLKNGTKDLIREVAAQGTDYTLAFLTQRTIQDLFEVEAGSGEKVEEFVVLHQEPSPSEAISPRVARPYIQALHSISLDAPPPEQQEEDDLEKELQVKEEPSQLEELNAVMDQLTPIEKYALQFLEYLHVSEDELVAKVRLKLSSQISGGTTNEERMIIEEEEDLFTYTREDAYNMLYINLWLWLQLWTPPTPPQDDNDIYIDSVICLMYDSAPMPESKLPPVYIRKEHKRLKMDPSAAGRKKKKGHGETVIPPRSLFEKASMLKVRREGKDQKKNFSLKQQAPFAKPLPSLVKPAMEAGQDNPEWLISEDWALLQAMKQLLELPLNLTIVSPAHTPNWDLVSDVVNSCSRIYRSPKQCRNRYENVIIPREEGKSKNSRPLRTCQIYTQDDNATHIQLYNSRFELMKIIASKRSPPIKPLLGMNPFQKNPKHASVLAESGIGYDKPLPPIQVASQRAERIAKEKKVCTVYSSVGGNLIVNTVAGVPPSPFQANKRLVSPGQVIPGTLSPASAAGAQVVHSQQRAIPATAAPGEVVAIATGQGVRAVTPVTASAVVTTTLTPVQSQTRSLVTPATGMQLPQGKPITQAHLHMLRQQQLQQQQQQAASPQGIKAVGKPQVLYREAFHSLYGLLELLLKIHKQKLQMAQQQPGAGQQPVQVQPANPQAAQANPQLAAIAAGPRAGAVLAGTTVANLQVARLTRLPTQGQIQAQPGQTAQVTLTKPPVVSVPSVVSSAGVTTLPVTMAGISVAIGQAQKTVLTPPFPQMQVQQLLQMKKQQVAVQAAAALQKAVQPGQASVQQKMTVPTTQQQKVTYAATTQLQPSIKTQFFTTSIAQAGKPTGAQQIQVAKLPQIVQGQSTVANIQQIVSSPQQIQPQTVALTQTTSSAQPQVQMIPAGTATAQVVQQKLLQQQVVTAAASPQIQTPPPHSPAQQAPVSAAAESPVQQQPAKGQARGGAMRGKTQAKPSGGSS